MPLTLVHPAVVIPAAVRGPLPASALAIGSLTPDFPKLLPPLEGTLRTVGIADAAQFTHTYPGAVSVGAALGAVALAVFHLALKRPLVSLAPAPLARRLAAPAAAFRIRGARDAFWTAAALVLGAASHVLLDDVTHIDPRLGLYRVLQTGITLTLAVASAVMIAVWLTRLPAAPKAPLPPSPLRHGLLWTAITAVPLAALAWGTVTFDGAYRPDLYLRLHHGATFALPVLAGLILLYAAAWHLLTPRRTTRRASGS
ncbi:DUF4184 family protein [Streptomyces sp. NPDC050161]|uniref:DUF4184 family protein n=1 Tax=Streptomyces sp. NPDC050161 TaxID=3365604 RepID=UPI0037B9E81F